MGGEDKAGRRARRKEAGDTKAEGKPKKDDEPDKQEKGKRPRKDDEPNKQEKGKRPRKDDELDNQEKGKRPRKEKDSATRKEKPKPDRKEKEDGKRKEKGKDKASDRKKKAVVGKGKGKEKKEKESAAKKRKSNPKEKKQKGTKKIVISKKRRRASSSSESPPLSSSSSEATPSSSSASSSGDASSGLQGVPVQQLMQMQAMAMQQQQHQAMLMMHQHQQAMQHWQVSQQWQAMQQGPMHQELALRGQQEEEQRKEEQAGRVRETVTKVIQRVRVATPEAFEALRKELGEVLSAELPKSGDLRRELLQESEKAIDAAKRSVNQIKEVRKKQAQQLEMEKMKVRMQEKAVAIAERIKDLTALVPVQAEKLRLAALPLERVESAESDMNDAELENITEVVEVACDEIGRAVVDGLAYLNVQGIEIRMILPATTSIKLPDLNVSLATLEQHLMNLNALACALRLKALPARQALERRRASKKHPEEVAAIFRKYDCDRDGVLSKKEVLSYAQGEFKFTPFEDALDRVWNVFVQEFTFGVPERAFQQLKVALGVAREVARDRQRKEERIARGEETPRPGGVTPPLFPEDSDPEPPPPPPLPPEVVLPPPLPLAPPWQVGSSLDMSNLLQAGLLTMPQVPSPLHRVLLPQHSGLQLAPPRPFSSLSQAFLLAFFPQLASAAAAGSTAAAAAAAAAAAMAPQPQVVGMALASAALQPKARPSVVPPPVSLQAMASPAFLLPRPRAPAEAASTPDWQQRGLSSQEPRVFAHRIPAPRVAPPPQPGGPVLAGMLVATSALPKTLCGPVLHSGGGFGSTALTLAAASSKALSPPPPPPLSAPPPAP